MGNNKYKILIVEDEANIRSFIKANLETSDYQVLCAETCELGMMMYASHHPDLIVLDLGLPDRDGMSLIQEVRKTDTVPIIVLSARSNERDKVEALDLGANDYITKPFGTEELLARIRAVLRSHRHSEEKESSHGGKFRLQDLLIDYDTRQVFVGDRPDPDGIQHHGVSLRSRRKGADVCRHHSGGLGVFGLWQRQEAASQHEEHPQENGRDAR
jgi:two-component system KDP operon response regulator KdpE